MTTPAAADSAGLLLWQVTNRWQAAQRAALKPFDLTHVQFVLLASLARLATPGSEVTQRQLAEHAATDPMMTSQVIRTLEARTLVTRRQHAADGRAWAVAATARGVTLVDRANEAVEAVDRDFFAALGSRRTAFLADLRRLRKTSTDA